ncbi:MAG: AAA family ATPase, partial [Mycobacterium sp.]|uniref:AAA family ATPase n=1 Tax=Mycobacterium sp. TaxID=1785 RepID=UPI003F973E04
MHTESRSEWPIVARDTELRLALAALDGGAEFHGVALVGDSGVGKSTLARALADTLESGGEPSTSCSCWTRPSRS